MIIRTEALVLRRLEYGETSLIATLFTREKGKIAVMAKGARRMKSRFGSTLQPMSYTQVVFYYKSTRSLQTLSESAHVEPFHNISRHLERITAGLRIMELVDAFLQDEEQNPMVFNLVVQVLRRLDTTEERVENVLPFFQLRLASALGVAPAIDRESVQRLPEDGGLLALESGAVQPPDAAPQSARRASRTALRAFAIFARAELDDVMRMQLAPRMRSEVGQLIDDYLRYQFEDAYPSRSADVIGQLTALPTVTSRDRT